MKRTRSGTIAVALAAVAFIVAGCGMMGGSPTATFKSFFEAAQKKELAALKKSLSKGSLALMEKNAAAQKKTLDDLLKEFEFANDRAGAALPEIRNEKIDGDTATIELKGAADSNWETLPFVKEDGEWKVALDKFIDTMLKRLEDRKTNP